VLSGDGLNRLVLPVYLPSFIYSIGVGAAVAAGVLVGLSIGLTTSSVAALIAVAAGVGVVGTLVAGHLVARFGERRALAGATVSSMAVLLALCAATWLGLSGQVALFGLALMVTAAVDGVWSVARQSVLAESVQDELRGRALATYAAVQRAGRAVGPLIGAAAIFVAGPVAGFAVHLTMSAVACVLIVRHLPAMSIASHAPVAPTRTSFPATAFWILGSAMLILDLVRANKDLLVPIAGRQTAALAPAQIAIAISVSLWCELALFWPAGRASDRFGPTLVAATSLAVMCVGMLLLAIPARGSFVAAVVVLGLGNGLGAGAIKTIGVTIAPRHSPSLFLGRWTAYTSAGSLLGPILIAASSGTRTSGEAVATATLALVAGVVVATSGAHLIHTSSPKAADHQPGEGSSDDVR